MPDLSDESHLRRLERVLDWKFYFYLVLSILIRRIWRTHEGTDQVRHIITDCADGDMAFRVVVDVFDLLRDTSSFVLSRHSC